MRRLDGKIVKTRKLKKFLCHQSKVQFIRIDIFNRTNASVNN